MSFPDEEFRLTTLPHLRRKWGVPFWIHSIESHYTISHILFIPRISLTCQVQQCKASTLHEMTRRQRRAVGIVPSALFQAFKPRRATATARAWLKEVYVGATRSKDATRGS